MVPKVGSGADSRTDLHPVSRAAAQLTVTSVRSLLHNCPCWQLCDRSGQELLMEPCVHRSLGSELPTVAKQLRIFSPHKTEQHTCGAPWSDFISLPVAWSATFTRPCPLFKFRIFQVFSHHSFTIQHSAASGIESSSCEASKTEPPSVLFFF